MTITVSGVMVAARDMAAKLEVSVRSVIAFSACSDFSAYVDIDGDDLHWIVAERAGREVKRRTTDSLDELMHWLAVEVTFDMARAWGMKQRNLFPEREVTGTDRLAKQVELLRRLDGSWAAQAQAQHDDAYSHAFD
ncbi:Imm63 family immunity protein [Streptomyces triculaminicus]|uniref:Imm63 family immunity protein n=1 Tax=Streptomyces triculaminicus TaxID=2816232 RepID=UPI0037B258E7